MGGTSTIDTDNDDEKEKHSPLCVSVPVVSVRPSIVAVAMWILILHYLARRRRDNV